jgi:hypothetical protein
MTSMALPDVDVGMLEDGRGLRKTADKTNLLKKGWSA